MNNRYKRRTTIGFLGSIVFGGCNTINSQNPNNQRSQSQNLSSETPEPKSRPVTNSATPTQTQPPTPPQEDAVLATEQTKFDAETPTEVLDFSELSEEQKEVMRTALEEGVYHVCNYTNAFTLESLADRIVQLPSSDRYVRYNGSYYGVWLRISDEVSAATASSPSESELKGCNG